MSEFLIDLVDGKVPVHDADSYTENTSDWLTYPAPYACTHVIGVDNQKKLRRIPMAMFRSPQWNPTNVVNGLKGDEWVLRPAATGAVGLGATNALWIGSVWTNIPTTIQMTTTGSITFWSNGYFSHYGHIRTYPAGNNRNVYADGFVLWSSRAIKDDIQFIDNAKARVKQISPRKYKMKGKQRYGAIAEEIPAEFVSLTQEEDGTESKGVMWGDLFWILYQAVTELIDEVEDLKKEVKPK